MPSPRLRLTLAVSAVVAAALVRPLSSQTTSPEAGEWRSYGATVASTKYSPLDRINAANAGSLQIAWRQSAIPQNLRGGRVVSDLPLPTNYQTTPIMAGGLLYMSTGFGTVAALDPATGAVVWHEQVPTRDEGTSRGVHRRRREPVAGLQPSR